MIRTLKKITLSSLSILVASFVVWLLIFLNPSWSYAHETKFDLVTIYHNSELDAEAETVIKNAVAIIKKSDLYKEDITIDLCMNDDKLYTKLHPWYGNPLAYAVFDKTVVKNCDIDFANNLAETKWAVNNFEHRKFNLTYLLAHEFTHNLQFSTNTGYLISQFGKINWKTEGHADYVARQYAYDGKLKERIEFFIQEEKKSQNVFPVFELEDGTKQILSYFKYSLVVQYLIEQKEMDYLEICDAELNLDDLYAEMVEWSKR